MQGAFTVEDLVTLSRLVIDAWDSGRERDWAVPAGTLEWSCLHTADHLVDCVFSYAFFLASGKQDNYPNFGELHALAGATSGDLIEGLQATSTMLASVIVTAAVDTRAVIWLHPSVQTGSPEDFAARGALELVLHGYDVCAGLGVPFDPPTEACQRLLAHTAQWPGNQEYVATTDPWSDLVARSGRPRPTA
jgi:hypothetical protein